MISDIAVAVDGPRRLSSDAQRARHLLCLVPDFPTVTWGRDELGTGEMWNSNSLVSWLLAKSGHNTAGVGMPEHGRAPGWAAGVTVASRSHVGQRGRGSGHDEISCVFAESAG